MFKYFTIFVYFNFLIIPFGSVNATKNNITSQKAEKVIQILNYDTLYKKFLEECPYSDENKNLICIGLQSFENEIKFKSEISRIVSVKFIFFNKSYGLIFIIPREENNKFVIVYSEYDENEKKHKQAINTDNWFYCFLKSETSKNQFKLPEFKVFDDFFSYSHGLY